MKVPKRSRYDVLNRPLTLLSIPHLYPSGQVDVLYCPQWLLTSTRRVRCLRSQNAYFQQLSIQGHFKESILGVKPLSYWCVSNHDFGWGIFTEEDLHAVFISLDEDVEAIDAVEVAES